MINKLKRQDAVKILLRNCRPKERKKLEALMYYAGETESITEVMHESTSKVINFLRMAAEIRGYTVEQLKAFVIQQR